MSIADAKVGHGGIAQVERYSFAADGMCRWEYGLVFADTKRGWFGATGLSWGLLVNLLGVFEKPIAT